MIKTLSEEQGQLGEVTQMLLVQEKKRKKKKDIALKSPTRMLIQDHIYICLENESWKLRSSVGWR